MIALVATLAAGCSQVLGFKDPKLGEDDAGTSDDAALDGSVGSAGNDGSVDAAMGSGSAPLWVFTTNGAYQGDFGASNGGRAGADALCNTMYQIAYTARQCNNIHAIIQVDNVDDTLGNMAARFQIPAGAPVLRATADATKVANQWDDVVNRTVTLLAPVSTSTNVFFWSGRGTSANRNCSSWGVKDPALLGDGGDATKVSSWMSQMAFTCDSLTPHLLCICW